jgi:hypothetical protein
MEDINHRRLPTAGPRAARRQSTGISVHPFGGGDVDPTVALQLGKPAPGELAGPFYNPLNLLRVVFLVWIFPLIRRGYRRTVALDDLQSLPKGFTSEVLGETMQAAWTSECKTAALQGRPSRLLYCFVRLFWQHFTVGGILLSLAAAAQVGQPYLLVQLVKNIVRGAPDAELYQDAMFVSLSLLASVFTVHPGYLLTDLAAISEFLAASRFVSFQKRLDCFHADANVCMQRPERPWSA